MMRSLDPSHPSRDASALPGKSVSIAGGDADQDARIWGFEG
jgi:hypothetical protein